MDQVKFTVQGAARRNMCLWIQDESDYPGGFAGRYISQRYLQLGMQDVVADIRVHLAPSQKLTMSEVRSVFAECISQGFYVNVEVNRTETARYGLSFANVKTAVSFGIASQNIEKRSTATPISRMR